ncbi:MAG: energy transducer TonB [Gammaproteobacteria bacterium]
MQFSHTYNGHTSKLGKIAIVAAVHLLIGSAVMHSMHMRSISIHGDPDTTIVVLPTDLHEPPPAPVTPPDVTPMQQTQVFVPPDAPFTVATEPTIVGTTTPPDNPPVVVKEGPVAPPVTPPAVLPKAPPIRSAVLADANSCVKPDYPARAARLGETGTVTLALLVDATGSVTSSRIDRSSGSRDLDRAAQAALSMCKFKPAMEGGVPQSGWAQIQYVWTLD